MSLIIVMGVLEQWPDNGQFYFGVLAAAMLSPAAADGGRIHIQGDTPMSANRLPISIPAIEWKLQHLLEAKMKALKIPGAIVSVDMPSRRRNALIYISSGLPPSPWTLPLTSDSDSYPLMDVKSYMRIGSITKTFIATIILKLMAELHQDDPKFLDTPAARQLPTPITDDPSQAWNWNMVPNGDKITIRQLLNHPSGLFNYTDDKAFFDAVVAAPERQWKPNELVKIAFHQKPYFDPASPNTPNNKKNWAYSNTNYMLLGLMIENLTQQTPVKTVLQEKIFNPSPGWEGLGSTYMPDSSDIHNPHPQGYTGQIGPKHPIPCPTWDPSSVWTAGALISTVDDLRIWVKALATGQLLTDYPRMRNEQQNDWVPIGENNEHGEEIFYGLGVEKCGGFLGHAGMVPGFSSTIGYLQNERQQTEVRIIVLTNLDVAPSGGPADELGKVIHQTLFAWTDAVPG